MRETHEYILSSSQIIRETVYLDGVEQYILVYIYDELGAPIGLKYRTPSYAENVYDCYFFEKNLQGDIVAIYNASGAKIVTYTYDAWGNVTTKITSGTSSKDRNIANINPFRYRGYYYDIDIGMYYLQSRYYNPNWGRFLNGDEQINSDVLGSNMFCYCGNNPVMRVDDNGSAWWVPVAAIVGGLVGGVSKIVTNVLTGEEWHNGVLGATAGGAVYGALAVTGSSVWVAGFAAAATESILNEGISYIPNGDSKKEFNSENTINSVGSILGNTLVGGLLNGVSGSVAGKFLPVVGETPVDILSSLIGQYAIKSHAQTLIQAGLIVLYSTIASYAEDVLDNFQTHPTPYLSAR